MKKNILALALILALLAGAVLLLSNIEGRAPASAAASAPSSFQPSADRGISLAVETQTPPAQTESEKTPRYIFVMIGDGMGKGQRGLAREYLKLKTGDKSAELAMDTLPVKGEVSTASANSNVTDSAASGTALSTGCKTNNGMLAVSPDGEKLETIMEKAKEQGMSTGVITTTSVTDATPAAFCVHCDSRALENDIAEAYLKSGIDFIAGGGACHFLPASYSGGDDTWGDPLYSARTDSRDLFGEFAGEGYKTFCGAEGWREFKEYGPAPGSKVFAAFSNISLPFELDRINEGMDSPTLSQITQKAISSLESDPDGFVLMVEGARIDHACHYNDAASAAYETLAFDDAVKTAYDFYAQHPEETLILVTADHETGGLGLKSDPDLSVLDGVRVSVQGRLKFAYNGDRAAFYKYISDNLGLKSLSASEKKKIKTALDFADKKKTDRNLYSSYDPPAIAACGIVSDRAGIGWTAFSHTGTNVPLTAAGWESARFSGLHGNDGIGRLLFEIVGLKRE